MVQGMLLEIFCPDVIEFRAVRGVYHFLRVFFEDTMIQGNSQFRKKRFLLEKHMGTLTNISTREQSQKVTKNRGDAAVGTCMAAAQQWLGWVTSRSEDH